MEETNKLEKKENMNKQTNKYKTNKKKYSPLIGFQPVQCVCVLGLWLG